MACLYYNKQGNNVCHHNTSKMIYHGMGGGGGGGGSGYESISLVPRPIRKIGEKLHCLRKRLISRHSGNSG